MCTYVLFDFAACTPPSHTMHLAKHGLVIVCALGHCPFFNCQLCDFQLGNLIHIYILSTFHHGPDVISVFGNCCTFQRSKFLNANFYFLSFGFQNWKWFLLCKQKGTGFAKLEFHTVIRRTQWLHIHWISWINLKWHDDYEKMMEKRYCYTFRHFKFCT